MFKIAVAIALAILGAIIGVNAFPNSAAAPLANTVEDEFKHDKIVCYLGSWSNYRPGRGNFKIEDIDPRLCTHLVYAFVGVTSQGDVRILDAWLDLDLGAFRRFNALKQINPKAKTIIAIGGWNEGSENFSIMASDPEKRKRFIENVVEFVNTHEFDGFDLDWEYPSDRGGKPEDKANFATLVREMKERFLQNDRPLLLTSAVKATQQGIDISYDVPTISKYFDFINIMSYDLHGAWDNITGINSPLYPHPSDQSEMQKMLNVKASMEAWINAGAPREKLLLGMGTYGRTFTLADPNNHGIGAPNRGAGQAGPYTREVGFVGYNEICEFQQAGVGWNVVWEETQKVPYMYKDNQWVGYDDVESITLKVNYAKELGLAGVMIWSLETDDFRGICGPKYPLLNAINNAFGKPVPTTTPSPTTESPTTTGSPRPPLPPSDICEKPGIIPHPSSCTKFIYCAEGMDDWMVTAYDCPKGLIFNEEKLVCDYRPEGNDCT